MHPVQEAFLYHDAIQCGFCTPGLVLAAVSLLEEIPNPTLEEVKEALQEQPLMDVFQELADLMSISEVEAKMYSLELAEGFGKATKHKITPEKAAECYLRFRNWDFKNTWLRYFRTLEVT